MQIRITSFAESEADIRHVRDAVFGAEQKVRRKLDWDGNDPDSIHVLAVDDEGNPIGTGRMQPDGKIGRLAVLKRWRGRSVGIQMLAMLVEAARTKGMFRVYLHAQMHALAFYEKGGFAIEGERFSEAGIPHVNMTKTTAPRHQEAP